MSKKNYEETGIIILICAVLLLGTVVVIDSILSEETEDVSIETANNTPNKKIFDGSNTKSLDESKNKEKKISGEPKEEKKSLLEEIPANIIGNEESDVRESADRFMHAYLSRNREEILRNSFFEGRIYPAETAYASMDEQIKILENAVQVYKQFTGLDTVLNWRISLRKVHDTQYNIDIILEIEPDTLSISPVAVQKVNGRWLVDAESFVTASNLAFVGGL